MYWLQLLDWYATSIPVVLVCILEVVIIGWIYGAKNFIKDIEFMINENVSKLWMVSWKIITPAILIVCIKKDYLLNSRL